MTAMKVVVDCSPDKATDTRLREVADESKRLIQAGDASSLEALFAEAKELIAAASAAKVQMVPLTDEELAQRAKDAAAAQERRATEVAASEARAALIEKLKSGRASGAEVQQALASLLGG